MDSIKYAKEKALTRFDRTYYRNVKQELVPESKQIDFVLIHPNSKEKTNQSSDNEQKQNQARDRLRNIFENKLRRDDFIVQETVCRDKIYKKLHCSFKRLCIEADLTNLQMPLDKQNYPDERHTNICSNFIYSTFATDKAVNPKSARFKVKRIHLFENHDNPYRFFRPAIRTLLVNNILMNINLIDNVNIDMMEDMIKDIKLLDDDVDETDLKKTNDNTGFGTTLTEAIDKKLQIINFPYMKKLGVYTDNLILHETSDDSNPYEERPDSITIEETRDGLEKKVDDPRKELNDEWTIFYKFQPLTKIRNYFGEKIAFYFTWSGLLMTSLWVPMTVGLIIFIYGIVNSASFSEDNSSFTNNETSKVTKTLAVFSEASDNDATPFYALLICVWGTLFLKLWKRKTATLAYKWAVDEFAMTEPNRPQFYGTRIRQHPVTNQEDWYYPTRKQLRKFMLSGLTIVFMLCIVLASVIGVIVYRVFASVDYCPHMPPEACVMVTTVVSSLLNTISILILSKIYDWIARRLTDWENHRTQTSFDDALIVKLFAFEFANNYSSCFYIAFVRGRLGEDGIFGLGEKYIDHCNPYGNCMPELSFQILFLISFKPLPKFFNDIVLLWFKRCINKKVQEKLPYVQTEALKPSLGDFTMEEHTEKIIQYGFLMLFAASLPIAPLIALITVLIDIRLDAKRMLWWYRRPLATIAQDIGIWYIILQFVNICGVISNGFLIGFTSSWGQSYGVYTRLWIVVGFEHIVFALKLIIDYLIPDVPSVVRLMATKHMHDMSITLMNDRGKLENNYNEDFTNGTKYHQSKDNTSLKIPAINRKEETEMKIVDEKRVLRSSSTQKRTYKAYKENRYQKIDTSSTHTSKKRNKKKKHQHPQQDRVDDNIEHPSLVQKLNHQSDALYYTTRDQDRRISFKVKGPRNYINAERPIITTIKKIGDSRHASPNADDSKA